MYVTITKVKRVTNIVCFAIVCFFAVREIAFRRSCARAHVRTCASKTHVLDMPAPPPETRSALNVFNETARTKLSTQKLTKKRLSTPRQGNPLYSDKVINPHPFNFTLSNEFVCVKNSSEDRNVFLLILVKCGPQHSFARRKIRKTWGGLSEVDGRRALTMFLVGISINSTLNAMVVDENSQHYDIIREDFIDDYRNLTYKTIMGWRWASAFCPDAEYVASADADALLNVHNIVRRLVKMPRKNYAEGKVQFKAKPFRDKYSKWRTSLELYPEPTYAPYFSGVCYVLSADVAVGVFRESVHVRFLPWDDVFVGLVLKRIGVKPRNVEKYLQFRTTNDAIEKALADGPAVLVGNISNHSGMKKDINVMDIWEKVARKQNGAGHGA